MTKHEINTLTTFTWPKGFYADGIHAGLKEEKKGPGLAIFQGAGRCRRGLHHQPVPSRPDQANEANRQLGPPTPNGGYEQR